MRNLIVLTAVGVALVATASFWLEEGEVVTLITTNESGSEFETRLWIVEIDDIPYLRAETENTAWVERIRGRPDVQLDRAGQRTDYRAVPIGADDIRDSVCRAIAEKYGRLDRVVAWFRDYSDSVPVRLQSRSPEQRSAHSDRAIGSSP